MLTLKHNIIINIIIIINNRYNDRYIENYLIQYLTDGGLIIFFYHKSHPHNITIVITSRFFK